MFNLKTWRNMCCDKEDIESLLAELQNAKLRTSVDGGAV